MINSVFDLAISLKFESENALDWISDLLGVCPTTYIPKGMTLFDFVKADKYIWVLTKRSSEYDGNKPIEIGTFFDTVPDILLKIEDIKQHARCSFRISVVSEWAQIGYTINPENLAYLNRLSIPLEISVFSWGRCVDETEE